MITLPLPPRRAARVLARAVRALAEWEESQHPRDDRGRFEGGGGGESSPDATIREANRLERAIEDRAEEISSSDREVQQRREVKAQIVNDLAPRVEESTEDYFNKTEGNVAEKAFVQGQLDLWAQTSGDHSPEAIEKQVAVQREFGLDDAATDHLDKPSVDRAGRQPTNEADAAYLRAEYENTQKFFADRGIQYISVFRGQHAEFADESPFENGNIKTVTMQPASSWSSNLDTATEFGAYGYTMATRVPVSRVLSTCVTGRGCLAEHEVILLGGPMQVRGWSASNYGNIQSQLVKGQK